jgi:uncharacterized protein
MPESSEGLMRKPLAPGLFTWPDVDPQLIGSRCGGCAATTFPTQSRCPRCGGRDMSELLLPRRGTLVSFTTQEYPPILPYAGDDSGASFEPFGVGLVQLDDVVRIDARLTESDPTKLAFGMHVELKVIPFYTDSAGDEVVTFAFAPVSANS